MATSSKRAGARGGAALLALRVAAPTMAEDAALLQRIMDKGLRVMSTDPL